ncbi:hypothetical protein IMZ29_00945 [Achromobacter sp. GG226]|uniref:hypothetical protein n=1 Tax=Verticiella alkaliphila TaxID=2779529 RepID=UPI001C0C5E78|nr:hypothetical protein [Verticiella sp. GG226]MBU4609170.1 hypothetical protein [Verticiella sp. GG226]
MTTPALNDIILRPGESVLLANGVRVTALAHGQQPILTGRELDADRLRLAAQVRESRAES